MDETEPTRFVLMCFQILHEMPLILAWFLHTVMKHEQPELEGCFAVGETQFSLSRMQWMLINSHPKAGEPVISFGLMNQQAENLALNSYFRLTQVVRFVWFQFKVTDCCSASPANKWELFSAEVTGRKFMLDIPKGIFCTELSSISPLSYRVQE